MSSKGKKFIDPIITKGSPAYKKHESFIKNFLKTKKCDQWYDYEGDRVRVTNRGCIEGMSVEFLPKENQLNEQDMAYIMKKTKLL